MESEIRRSILLGMAAILAGCGGGEADSSNSDSSVKKSKLTVLLYVNGSDLESGVDQSSDKTWFTKNQGGAATANIEELLQASYSPDVNVILQTGGTKKEGWDSIKRKQVKNQYLNDLGPAANSNASFADPQTLIDFIQWSKDKFPAEKYILLFWNHGGGPIGGFGSDQINAYNQDKHLRTKDIQFALEKSTQILGQKFELVGFDACLMASYEILASIKNTTKYYVASEDLEPGGGWDYTSAFNYIADASQINGGNIGKSIVNSFIEKQARDQQSGATLSTIDLAKFENFQNSLGNLFSELNNAIIKNGLSSWLSIAKIRSQSLDFCTNIYAGNDSTDLMDIGSFLESPGLRKMGILASTIDTAIHALNEVVILKRWDHLVNQTSGLTMYFPLMSITNSDKLEEYNKFIPKISGISQFINNYTAFANDNEKIPRITVGNPITSTGNEIFSTVSSYYYQQAYAALMDNNQNIISVQNIDGDENKISLTDSSIWPTIDNNPVSFIANSNVGEEDDTFIIFAIILSNSAQIRCFLLFSEDLVCTSYYEYNDPNTHHSSPRVTKLPTSAEIIIPSLYYSNEKINFSNKKYFSTNTGKDAKIIVQRKVINTLKGNNIFLGTCDLIGRFSFSSQPAII